MPRSRATVKDVKILRDAKGPLKSPLHRCDKTLWQKQFKEEVLYSWFALAHWSPSLQESQQREVVTFICRQEAERRDKYEQGLSHCLILIQPGNGASHT